MAWFWQGRDTIEWQEFREDVLFYKWKNDEIKKKSKLIIRPGQHAIFFSGGKIEGIFTEEGTFDIDTEIVPFLSTLSGIVSLRKDSGLRAEVYFVNAKELLLKWGTRQRIMIPTVEVPSGIPVGCNGNLVIEFRDYVTFIHKIAGVKSTYSLSDIKERIIGELGGILAEALLDNQGPIGVNALVALQANNRSLAKSIKEELDKELLEIGLGVKDLDILSINYPEEVQKMAEKVAAHSFVTDTAKYANIQMAEGFSKPGGGNIGSMGAQMAVGAQMAQQMQQQIQQSQNNIANQKADSKASDPALDRFCPKCRVMRSGKFCSECGTPTV